MDHPVKEIRTVIKTLTQGTPAEQERAVKNYFLPDAAFTHPFCAVPSFQPYTFPLTGFTVDSRFLILMVYRWYRILSPHIEVDIHSVVHDQKANILYVTLTQTFTFFFLPIYHAKPRFTILLTLSQRSLGPDGTLLPAATISDAASGTGTLSSVNGGGGDEPRARYYIAHQNDHYQVSEWLKFIAPFYGPALHHLWQLVATLFSILGALIFAPLSWMDMREAPGKAARQE